MDSSPSFRRRESEDNEPSPISFVLPDNAPPPTSFSTPVRGVGTSSGNGSNFPSTGENTTVRHPAMHSSMLTLPCAVEPREMMTPDPSTRYTHGNQVREDFVPKENMAFVTDEEGYDFYQQYARAAGFGITKLKRKPMSRLYACSRVGAGTFYKPGEERKRAKMSKRVNCKAAVKIKKRGKEWIYEKVMLEHNHTMNPDPSGLKHMYSHKNKDPAIMELVDDLQTCDVSPNATMNVLTKFNGDYELIPMNERDLRNRRASNVPKERADDVKKLRAFFNEFRAHNSKFYYDIEDDSEGVTKNIFWSHASCQANYAEFGDVITFDTTYKCNFYKMPLAMFVGSNHHLQNVIFGFALLRDETEETFEWAFRTFKACMGDKEPHCILTDQDVAMEKALPLVFPNTLHRLCRWHVWERHKDDLKGLFNLHDGLKDKLLTAINHPLTPLEFESAWKDMVNEYGLQSDPTISSLYDQRARWIAAYFKAVYCGRMTSTQRSESVNRLVKRNHVDPITPLHEFARKMYLVLQKRKEAEARETIACQARPETITNYPLEHQLSRIYTRAVFKKYKDAYVYGTSFLTKKVDAGRFLVVYGRDGPAFSWSQHEFKVVCDEEKEEYKCECMQWEHTGLLCPHLIIVMTNQQIQKFPNKYVLRRYTRYARIDPPYDRNDTLQVGADGTAVSVKHFNMLREAFACVRAGDRSTVAYERVMDVLKELRVQVEGLPPDVMPVFDEGGCSGPADNVTVNFKAPPISKTKGSRSEEGERHIGARGPKKCTRRCGKCGLMKGHNKTSCTEKPQSFAIGGTRGGRGRGRGRTGRGRRRGRETATRRRLIHDEVEEEEDDQSEDDVVDGESSRGTDDSD